MAFLTVCARTAPIRPRVAGRIVQFSGGEPTIYPRFLDVLRMARELGFSHTQVATNGIQFTSLEFAEQCKEAGLHTLYLQFDGVCDDVYRRTRGESLWEKKLPREESKVGRRKRLPHQGRC